MLSNGKSQVPVLIEPLVTPSPSARLLARSSTSAKKKRPSTYTTASSVPISALSDRRTIRYIILTIHRLLAIKEKLKQQRQHMEDLDKHMSVIP
jgi:hypothetical protein